MSDLARLRNDLATIADCYAQLAARQSEQTRDERTKPGHDRRHRDGKGGPLVHGQPTGGIVAADPVAGAIPSGPTAQRRNGPVVGGSHEAPTPVPLDLVDLTGAARHGSLDVADTSPWPQDQTGHLPVATELDFWVCDIADLLGEKLPMPTAPVLAMWLHERAGWAWDHYGALDEMAVTVDRIARALYAIVWPGKPQPVVKVAPCPGCGSQTLSGDGERVWCEDEACGRVLTEAEYATWAAAEAHRELNGGVGVSARAIAIKYGRPVGTVKRWAHQYGWPRSSGQERPVLYLASAVDETVAGILEREAREREAKVA